MNRLQMKSLTKGFLSFVLIIMILLLLCYVPEADAGSLYPVEINNKQAEMIHHCIGESFSQTENIPNNMYRYAMLVGAVGECVFSVAYPNGTIEQYQEFLSDWQGSNQVNVPFKYLEPDKYKF